MVSLSIVQGRLSSQVGTRYQHFPIHAWRKEFATASEIGFDGIEWIISDYSNPIFDDVTLEEIAELSTKHKVKVTSISLDVLLYNPVFKLPWDDVLWLFDRISNSVKHLGVQRIAIPLEETSGIHSPNDVTLTVDTLRKILEHYSNTIPLLCIETDLSPQNAKNILELDGVERLGLLVDLGNIAANGFKIDDFVSCCGSRIYGLHIKDRSLGFGPSCPLGKGSAEIKIALDRCKELPRLADITFQAYRSSKEFIKDAKMALQYVKELMGKQT